jgi:carbonic anhydrase
MSAGAKAAGFAGLLRVGYIALPSVTPEWTHVLTVLCMPAGGAAAGKPHAESPQAAGHSVHWAYAGTAGPSHWWKLDPAYVVCGTGTHQSPIDLTHASLEDLEDPELHYQPSELHVLNNGHTVQVNYDKGSYMEVNRQRYDVVQFHYHAPSEHRMNGKTFAAELHVVHKNADGKLAVVGVLLEEGAENPAYQALLDNLPYHESKEAAKGVKLNVAGFLPTVHTTFRYDGSLTTPPCTEGVSWLVMTTPVNLSRGQLAALEKVFKGNNRPVQPLNGRKLTEDSTP